MDNLETIYDAINNNFDMEKIELRFSNIWNEIKDNDFFIPALESLRNGYDEYIRKGMPSLTYNKTFLFEKNGNRAEFEDLYFHRRKLLNSCVVNYGINRDSESLKNLENALWDIANEPTWALPAHFDLKGHFEQQELYNKKVDNINDRGYLEINNYSLDTVIDLFASETGLTLSEITAMYKDDIDKNLLIYVRSQVKDRLLKPFMQLGEFNIWEILNMNWSIVCGGSIGIIAMYLIDNPKILAPILLKSISCMESFLDGYEDDGACIEGIMYWDYGFSFFIYFADMLKIRSNGVLNLFDDKKIRTIANFVNNMYLSENTTINFSDAYSKYEFNLGILSYLNDEVGIDIPNIKYADTFKNVHCNRTATLIRFFAWSKVNYISNDNYNDYIYENSQIYISRKNTGCNNTILVAKGGNNFEPHNHNDLGQFILHINNKTFITDLGPNEYCKDNFRDDTRYNLLPNNSFGHSVPIINGRGQGFGSQYISNLIDYKFGDVNKVIFEIDAYDTEKFIRKFTHTSNTEVVTLEDTFNFKKNTCVIERLVTYIQPIVKENKVYLTCDNTTISIFDKGVGSILHINTGEFINKELVKTLVYFIDFEYIDISNQKIKIEFCIEN